MHLCSHACAGVPCPALFSDARRFLHKSVQRYRYRRRAGQGTQPPWVPGIFHWDIGRKWKDVQQTVLPINSAKLHFSASRVPRWRCQLVAMKQAGGFETEMDMRELETFTAVAECRSYQKAAEKLQYTSSTMCKHISHLESELNMKLVERAGHTLLLTADGNRFLPHAQAMLKEYRLSMHMKDSATLTIGGCEINVENSLLQLFSRFTDKYPNIHINMRTGPNALVPDLVREEQVDVGFYFGDGQAFSDLETVVLYSTPAFFAAAAGHPLMREKRLTYEALNRQAFVYPHDSCIFVVRMMPEMEKKGIHWKSVTYLGGMQLVTRAVMNKGAVTMAPLCALKQMERDWQIKRLPTAETPPRAWEMMLIGPHSEQQAVQTLKHFVQEEVVRMVQEEPLLTLGPDFQFG